MIHRIIFEICALDSDEISSSMGDASAKGSSFAFIHLMPQQHQARQAGVVVSWSIPAPSPRMMRCLYNYRLHRCDCHMKCWKRSANIHVWQHP
jgi:hypothetical protein